MLKVHLFIQKSDNFVLSPFQAGRYHSLVIEKDSFPHDALEIVAWTDDGLIMAARHRIYKHVQVCSHVFFFFITT
jgi:anthranilate/para-aminobenzoate synthase component II